MSDLTMDGLGARLKDVRLRAGMSLRELSRQAEVSPSFISQIENGKSQPSVATLYAFARILNMSIDELFDPQAREASAEVVDGSRGPGGGMNPTDAWHPSELASRISVVHPSHRSQLTMAEGVVWERLAATPEHGVNFMKIHYAPGATSTAGGELQSHDGYEYGYVLRGRLQVRVGSEEFVLQEGESLGFDSNIPHVLRNVGDDEFEGVWFVHGRWHGTP